MPRYPIEIAGRKGLGLAARAPSGNGDPDAPVEVDTQEVPPRAAMPNEIELRQFFPIEGEAELHSPTEYPNRVLLLRV